MIELIEFSNMTNAEFMSGDNFEGLRKRDTHEVSLFVGMDWLKSKIRVYESAGNTVDLVQKKNYIRATFTNSVGIKTAGIILHSRDIDFSKEVLR